MSLVVLFAVAALSAQDPNALTAAQAPQPAAPAATPAPAPESPDQQRVVCRTETPVGSRFASRTCLTRAQWDERTRNSREMAQRARDRNTNHGAVRAPGH